jgi:DNA-binding response OmpR family regulator
MDKTMLVIDDDEATLRLEQLFFSGEGYTVSTAPDGDVGVEMALQLKPTIILCDVMMGAMHGLEVLRTLRTHPDMKQTVIIMTSAKAYKPDIDRARLLGATDYMVKPFHLDELLAAVERHLASFGQQAPA